MLDSVSRIRATTESRVTPISISSLALSPGSGSPTLNSNRLSFVQYRKATPTATLVQHSNVQHSLPNLRQIRTSNSGSASSSQLPKLPLKVTFASQRTQPSSAPSSAPSSPTISPLSPVHPTTPLSSESSTQSSPSNSSCVHSIVRQHRVLILCKENYCYLRQTSELSLFADLPAHTGTIPLTGTTSSPVFLVKKTKDLQKDHFKLKSQLGKYARILKNEVLTLEDEFICLAKQKKIAPKYLFLDKQNQVVFDSTGQKSRFLIIKLTTM